jgi:hypothetical protein
MFSAERMGISAPYQASVGRASMRGSGKRKSTYVWRKTYTLIYPYPVACIITILQSYKTPLESSVSDATIWSITYGHQLL